MGFFQRLAQDFHHQLDGPQVELGEKEQVYIVQRQSSLIQSALDEFWPVLGVERLWEFLDEFYFRLAEPLQGFRGAGAVSSTGIDSQGIMISSAGEERNADKELMLSARVDRKGCQHLERCTG